MRRKVLLVVGVLALVAVGVLGLRAAQVHSESGEWRLTPSVAPPHFHALGRDYRRSGVAPEPSHRSADPTVVGRTPGGGLMFLPPDATSTTAVPTVVYVYDGETTWAYELVGGP